MRILAPFAARGSEYVGVIEQLVFYFAAVAGGNFFGQAVEGWLILKAVSRYALWERSDSGKAHPPEYVHPSS
jgi:hypothetical protein